MSEIWEEKIREGRSSRISKDMFVCAQDLVGKKKFLIQPKDSQRRDINSCFILYICSGEEVCKKLNKNLYFLPKYKNILFTIFGYPVGEVYSIFEEGLY